jgi:oligoendopeptidase F
MIQDMNKNIGDLNNYLSLVLHKLDEVNDDNFDSSISNINQLIKKIEDKRTYLKNNYSLHSLQSNCDLANTTVKQIKLKFDDIIEAKKEKESFIVSELNKMSNEKKIIKYKR